MLKLRTITKGAAVTHMRQDKSMMRDSRRKTRLPSFDRIRMLIAVCHLSARRGLEVVGPSYGGTADRRGGHCISMLDDSKTVLSKNALKLLALKIIGRALTIIFATSKRFFLCNAIGIMFKFRNYW